jgi:hypothetical protein
MLNAITSHETCEVLHVLNLSVALLRCFFAEGKFDGVGCWYSCVLSMMRAAAY